VTIDQQEIDARRHEARKREIVGRVLPVVEQKVAEAGSYANLRVEDILQDALLSRSTFYRYFKDKNELLLALGEPVFADVRAAAIRPWDRDTAPTRDELRAELRRNFDIYLPHVPVIGAMVEASYHSPACGSFSNRASPRSSGPSPSTSPKGSGQDLSALTYWRTRRPPGSPGWRSAA
jgi:AcrR family transcriptional regulator